jgi:hypothetical protein
MKRKFALLKTMMLLGITIMSAAPLSTFAQPDYVFRNAVLLSGTNLQVGAKYRFPNVKPGIDGIIEIKDMKNGITLQTLDGGSGFADAFQPSINAPANRSGYVEFQLDLVVSGTFSTVKVPELPMTAIDIDGATNGSGSVFEFDQFEHSSQYRTMYDMVGSSLNVQSASGWSTVKNVAGVDYPSIDTVQKNVMFTAIYGDVDKVLFRVGADNRTNASVNRLRSIYFKKFNFASGLLPVGSLLNFGGFVGQAGVQLNWQLAANCKPGTITLERSTDATKFMAITDRAVYTSDRDQKDGYFDRSAPAGTVFYRLKLQSQSGQVEYTRILAIRAQGDAAGSMRVYPSIVDGNTTISFQAAERADAYVTLVDMNGRSIKQHKIAAGEGANAVQLDGLDMLGAGVYVVAVTVGKERMTQRIVKR